MTDFLGRLIQRSLPTVERAAASELLAPRLPGLFESTGNEWNASSLEATSQSSDSGMREKYQNEEGPHPSVMASTRMSRSDSGSQLDEIASHNSFRANDPIDKPVISVSRIAPTTVQHQVRRHEAEKIGAQNERQLTPLPTARSMPSINMTPQMNRKMENANPMIDRPSGTTVRINIGRIEVRAVLPPQSVPPTRKTLPEPKMTIEEYAKQRSERKS